MARRAAGKFPGAGKVQHDSMEVNQFSRHAHGLEYLVRAIDLGLAGTTMMIVKMIRLYRGDWLVDCHQRASMQRSFCCGSTMRRK
jgi:hypothetical protein